MAICTHWEGKDIDEDGREEEDKSKEDLASWRHKAFPQTSLSCVRNELFHFRVLGDYYRLLRNISPRSSKATRKE